MFFMPIDCSSRRPLRRRSDFGGKARALLGAQFVALERDRFHARLQRIAAEAPASP